MGAVCVVICGVGVPKQQVGSINHLKHHSVHEAKLESRNHLLVLGHQGNVLCAGVTASCESVSDIRQRACLISPALFFIPSG